MASCRRQAGKTEDVDAFLLGRRTYAGHAQALEPLPPGDPFGDLMNAPKKYVVSRTLEKPIWRDTTIIRDNVVETVRTLKAEPGRTILTDGSSQLVRTLLAHDLVDELHLLYPPTLGRGKRIWADDAHTGFTLRTDDGGSEHHDDCQPASWKRAQWLRQDAKSPGTLARRGP